MKGEGSDHLFRHEAGGHRWQRIPPSEKRGRVHTSTITVAILPVPRVQDVRLDPRDLDITFCRGSGAGGQHRNKTDSAIQIHHIPSGLIVRSEGERSQHQNREAAMSALRARLSSKTRTAVESARAADRRAQVGTGQRGDKIRTIRVQDGRVHDHRTDRKMALEPYLRGEIEGVAG